MLFGRRQVGSGGRVRPGFAYRDWRFDGGDLGSALQGRPGAAAGQRKTSPNRLETTLAGVGIAVVIWASAAFADYESIRKLIEHGHTSFVGPGSRALSSASSATRRWPATRCRSAGGSVPPR